MKTKLVFSILLRHIIFVSSQKIIFFPSFDQVKVIIMYLE